MPNNNGGARRAADRGMWERAGDPDGDGIANRRIVITESYDAEGLLVELIREVDREADGIIDARKVTRYDQ